MILDLLGGYALIQMARLVIDLFPEEPPPESTLDKMMLMFDDEPSLNTFFLKSIFKDKKEYRHLWKEYHINNMIVGTYNRIHMILEPLNE